VFFYLTVLTPTVLIERPKAEQGCSLFVPEPLGRGFESIRLSSFNKTISNFILLEGI